MQRKNEPRQLSQAAAAASATNQTGTNCCISTMRNCNISIRISY